MLNQELYAKFKCKLGDIYLLIAKAELSCQLMSPIQDKLGLELAGYQVVLQFLKTHSQKLANLEFLGFSEHVEEEYKHFVINQLGKVFYVNTAIRDALTIKMLKLERGVLSNEVTAKKWLSGNTPLKITRNIGYIRLNAADVRDLCVGDVLLLDSGANADIKQQKVVLGDVDDSLYERGW